MIRCRVLGHRYRFTAEGRTMSWRCDRGCGAGGSKQYPSTELARRYAAGLDRPDTAALGKRAPLIGLLPLRIGRLIRRLAGR